MKKVIVFFLLGIGLLSCNKKRTAPTNFDVAFYRGMDMRKEIDYVVIDGEKQSSALLAINLSKTTTCSTDGLLHIPLNFGTHSITYWYEGTPIGGNSQTLTLTSTGAALDGKTLPLQSCNKGLSVIIEDF